MNEQIIRNGIKMGDFWIPGSYLFYLSHQKLVGLNGFVFPKFDAFDLDLFSKLESNKNVFILSARRMGTIEKIISFYLWRNIIGENSTFCSKRYDPFYKLIRNTANIDNVSFSYTSEIYSTLQDCIIINPKDFEKEIEILLSIVSDEAKFSNTIFIEICGDEFASFSEELYNSSEFHGIFVNLPDDRRRKIFDLNKSEEVLNKVRKNYPLTYKEAFDK